MTQPAFPLICITKDKGLDLVPTEIYFSKVATSALADTSVYQDTFLFDKNGNVWTYQQVSDKFKNNFITKFLAKTFYNPILDAKVIWTNVGTYQIKDIQNKLKCCVDKDDDIITQFAEADVIKSSLDQATTFADILKVLNKYVFDPNEQELWEEQKSRPK
ncbi:hypothetical protein [Ferruginibacter sp. SUN106]|uniref:hypothetical protein n=1 Tax=Ferruginibacter sp. SUN106 TaxID=2978348 RepID=UPI003D369AB2